MEAVKLQAYRADSILNTKLKHKLTRENEEPKGRRGRDGGKGGGGSQGRRDHQGAALRAQGSK